MIYILQYASMFLSQIHSVRVKFFIKEFQHNDHVPYLDWFKALNTDPLQKIYRLTGTILLIFNSHTSLFNETCRNALAYAKALHICRELQLYVSICNINVLLLCCSANFNITLGSCSFRNL